MDEGNKYDEWHQHLYFFLNYSYKDSGFARREQCSCGDIRERERTQEDRRIFNAQVEKLVEPWKFRE